MNLQAFKGIGLVIAATLVAEVGIFSRFDNPRKLMAYLGLVPGEPLKRRFRSATRDNEDRQLRPSSRALRSCLVLPCSGQGWELDA